MPPDTAIATDPTAPDSPAPETVSQAHGPTGSDPERATLMVVEVVPLEHRGAFDAWLAGVHGALRDQPGFSSVDVIRQPGPSHARYTILVKFQTRGALARWQASDVLADWRARRGSMAARPPEFQEAMGLALWFDQAAAPTPRVPAFWKRATLSAICVYPMIILLSWVLDPLIGAMPTAARILVIVVLLSLLLTWPIMPLASRMLKPWLYPGRG